MGRTNKRTKWLFSSVVLLASLGFASSTFADTFIVTYTDLADNTVKTVEVEGKDKADAELKARRDFSNRGLNTTITKISEKPVAKKVYKITFNDGTPTQTFEAEDSNKADSKFKSLVFGKSSDRTYTYTYDATTQTYHVTYEMSVVNKVYTVTFSDGTAAQTFEADDLDKADSAFRSLAFAQSGDRDYTYAYDPATQTYHVTYSSETPVEEFEYTLIYRGNGYDGTTKYTAKTAGEAEKYFRNLMTEQGLFFKSNEWTYDPVTRTFTAVMAEEQVAPVDPKTDPKPIPKGEDKKSDDKVTPETNPAVKLGNQKAAQKAEQKYAPKATLPKTGDGNTATFVIAGLAVLSLAGLALKRKEN